MYQNLSSSCFSIIIYLFIFFSTGFLKADPLNCDLSQYKKQDGLLAEVVNQVLTITWAGDRQHQLRIQFIINEGVPTIRELAIKQKEQSWQIVASHIIPEYRVVSGLRRVTQQQTEPLEALGIPLKAELLDEIKWEAFWDAPLYVSDEPPKSHKSSIPAAEPFANHPGMPRQAGEITRAKAEFQAQSCKVVTNGSRIEISFPGVKAGIFRGYLQFDVFKGSNLVRQMLVAKTDHPSAAFKYDAGLSGLNLNTTAGMVWRDLVNQWQEYQFGGLINQEPVVIKSNNRLIAAQSNNAAIAAFPPPHSFYWARESEQNLGYNWYRKDNDASFSFGIRQAEQEEDPEFYHNFALYSARPGSWQRMPVFYYISRTNGEDAIREALKFTHGDQFKPLPGYKVMGHHYHVGLVKRLKEKGGFNHQINDISTMKGIGIDIFSIIDGVRGPARHDRGMPYVEALAEYYQAARSQSDRDFLVMPNDENSTGGRPPFMGGHYDILIPGPVYWKPSRDEQEPLYHEHPEYGRIYNIAEPMDLMHMTEQENMLISMPHPRSKRSTGYPDAIRDEPQFEHENYFGLGYRWGMGIDASEIRLGQYRFLTLWNEANNWMAAKNLPPKYAIAISEARSDIGHRGKPPWDDTYGMSPVNYLKLKEVPSVDDMSSIIHALRSGEYFMTTGEVLIPQFEIQGEKSQKTIIAQVEWTFPLDFVEVVWGDGKDTNRKIISTTELLPFGSKRFEIPFDATGKKWVRFAAWDVATNGALVQPVNLRQ
ncbi:MAG: hypothetical protein ACNS62_04150 [Candidatus Cyclobacteriaceae bacterium M3_2C_046]